MNSLETDLHLGEEEGEENNNQSCSIWIATKDEGRNRDLTADTDIVPPEYISIGIEGVIRENDRNVARLLELLNEDRRRWHKISIYEGFVDFFFDTNPTDEQETALSETHISVLQLAMQRTKLLTLDIFHTDEAMYRCLGTGLSSPPNADNNGIEELHISHCNARHGVNQEHARLLAEGLALSKTLRKLKLSLTAFFNSARPPAEEGPARMVGLVLLDGIRGNTSIVELDLEIGDIVDAGFVSHLAAALQSRPKGLHSLRIANHELTEADLGNLGVYLGQEDCSLRELVLNNTNRLEDPTALFQDLQNTKVHTLNLSGVELSSDTLALLPSAFPCLSELDLSQNCIDDLSFLDPLLCEDSTLLESLHLQNNPIGRESMIEFASKIPRMKGLRRLSLFDNPFLQSPSAVDALLLHILKNKSLESLHATRFDHEKVDLVVHCLNLNRGGRRGIDLESALSTVDRKLWPLIFHRCMAIQKYQGIKSTGWTSRGTDVRIQSGIIFWLLRHRYLLS
mmetsp:Transcript_12399/g.29516  ORF Transcript_12399/g.29516 Transcript_12399/m.29516 type:complete len:511 (+) Transcript_12399:325-1857(+)